MTELNNDFLRRKDDVILDKLVKDYYTHARREEILMKTLRADVESIKQNTEDLVQFWTDAKGFIAIMRIIGKIVKWGSPIIVAVVAAWYAIKGVSK